MKYLAPRNPTLQTTAFTGAAARLKKKSVWFMLINKHFSYSSYHQVSLSSLALPYSNKSVRFKSVILLEL